MLFCCFSGNMTQPALRQCENHVRFETSHCCFQSCVSFQRPHEIFVIGYPCCRPGPNRLFLSRSTGRGNRSGVCTRRSLAKSALLATCNSNGERSTNIRCITMRTPQSFLGGTMLTSSTLNFSNGVTCEPATGVSMHYPVWQPSCLCLERWNADRVWDARWCDQTVGSCQRPGSLRR